MNPTSSITLRPDAFKTRHITPPSTALSKISNNQNASANLGYILDAIRGGTMAPLYVNGNIITRDLAMSYSVIFRSISLLAGSTARLPLQFSSDRKNVVKPREIKNMEKFWNEGANSGLSSSELQESIVTELCLVGNAYLYIDRRSTSFFPDRLVPIRPDSVSISKATNNMIIYKFETYEDNTIETPESNILHFRRIKIPSTSNFLNRFGIVPIRALQSIIWTGVKGEEYVRKFFEANKFLASNVISFEQELSTTQKEEVIEYIKGYADSNYPLLLPPSKVSSLINVPSNQELRSLRDFQIEEIARAYGVPPTLLGIPNASPPIGSGISETTQGFIRYSLVFYLNTIEREIKHKLLPFDCYAEFNLSKLVRADINTLIQLIPVVIGGSQSRGIMSINEVRDLMHLDPIDGGDDINSAYQQPTETNNEGGNNEGNTQRANPSDGNVEPPQGQ